jgi:hypothetical protein
MKKKKEEEEAEQKKLNKKFHKTKRKHIHLYLISNLKRCLVQKILKKQTQDNKFKMAKNLYIKAQRYIHLEYLIP